MHTDRAPQRRQQHVQSSTDCSKTLFFRESSTALTQLKFQLTGPHDREIWVLFFPALIALVLEPVQQVADTIIIGRLGVAELGAAGLGTVLFQFSLGFFSSLIFATTPKVASAMAEQDLHKVSLQVPAWMNLCFTSRLLVPSWLPGGCN